MANLEEDQELIYSVWEDIVSTRPPDLVNNPPHYTQGNVECIEAIEAMLTPEEWRGFLKGQVVKYLWREKHKGSPEEDLEKARWYLNKLLEGKG